MVYSGTKYHVPAAVQADVGIAIGAGTDVAIETAEFVLMRSDVRDIITAFDISRATFNRIKLNFMWAYGYNIVAVPFAAGMVFDVMHKTPFSGPKPHKSEAFLVRSLLWPKGFLGPK